MDEEPDLNLNGGVLSGIGPDPNGDEMEDTEFGKTGETNESLVIIERAIETYLKGAEQKCASRDFDKAIHFLHKAHLKSLKLPQGHPIIHSVVERQRKLAICQQLAPMHTKEPKPFMEHYVSMDISSVNEMVFRAFCDLCHLVRRKVFCFDLHIPEDVEFDERDGDSRHILGKIGDAPVAYARYWIKRTNGANWVVLDRLCTIKEYRCSGYAHGCLRQVVEETQQLGKNLNPPISIVIMHIPVRQLRVHEKLVQSGFLKLNNGHENSPVVFVEDNRRRLNTVHLARPLPNADMDLVQHDLALAAEVARRQESIVQEQNLQS